jgi:ABC-2 type transport system ATP-binding protein
MTILSVKHLYKTYSGKPAVKDISFSLNPGELLGLIGPNGAGKSSTIKMILDFIRPDSGEVEVFGHRMQEGDKNRIGYLPEEKGLYRNLTAMEQIIYLASLKGMDKALAGKKAVELLGQTGMLDNKKMKIKNMSKGMAQVIQFIITIIHEPRLLILDEPFSGLDPVNTAIMKRIIGDMRNEGRAVILSTHQMNQVEELCDNVLMIHHGSEVFYGPLSDIKARFRKHSVLVNVEGEIGELEGVTDRKWNRDSLELVLARDTTPQDILDRLRQQGIRINRFEINTPSLNEIFLNMTGKHHE